MKNKLLDLALFKKVDKLCNFTPEQRRMYCASLAIQMGYGGVSAVSKELNISPKTIRQGITDLKAGADKGISAAEVATPEMAAYNAQVAANAGEQLTSASAGSAEAVVGAVCATGSSVEADANVVADEDNAQGGQATAATDGVDSSTATTVSTPFLFNTDTATQGESANSQSIEAGNDETAAAEGNADEAKEELPGLFDTLFATHEAALEGDAEALAKLASLAKAKEDEAEEKAKAEDEVQKEEASKPQEQPTKTIQEAAQELLEQNSSRFAINGLRKTTLTSTKLTELLRAQGFTTNKDEVENIILDLGFEPDSLRINQVDKSLLDDDLGKTESLDDVFEAMTEVLEKQAEKRKQDAIAAAEAKALEAAKHLGQIKEQERLAAQQSAQKAEFAQAKASVVQSAPATATAQDTQAAPAQIKGGNSVGATNAAISASTPNHASASTSGSGLGMEAAHNTVAAGNVGTGTSNAVATATSAEQGVGSTPIVTAPSVDFKSNSGFGRPRLLDKNPELAKAARELLEEHVTKSVSPNGLRYVDISGKYLGELLNERGFVISVYSGLNIMKHLGYEPLPGTRIKPASSDSHHETREPRTYTKKHPQISVAEAWANAVAAAQAESEHQDEAKAAAVEADANNANATDNAAISEANVGGESDVNKTPEVKPQAQATSATNALDEQAETKDKGAIVHLAAQPGYKSQASRHGPARLIDKDPAFAKVAREILEANYIPNIVLPNGFRKSTLTSTRFMQLLDERGFKISIPSGTRVMESLGYDPARTRGPNVDTLPPDVEILPSEKHGGRLIDKDPAFAKAARELLEDNYLPNVVLQNGLRMSTLNATHVTNALDEQAETKDEGEIVHLAAQPGYKSQARRYGPPRLIDKDPAFAKVAREILEANYIPNIMLPNGFRKSTLTSTRFMQLLKERGFKISIPSGTRVMEILGYDPARIRGPNVDTLPPDVNIIPPEKHGGHVRLIDKDPAFAKAARELLEDNYLPNVVLQNGLRMSTLNATQFKNQMEERGFKLSMSSSARIMESLGYMASGRRNGSAEIVKDGKAKAVAVSNNTAASNTVAKSTAKTKAIASTLTATVSPLDKIKTLPYDFYVAPNTTGTMRCIDTMPKLTKLVHSILEEKRVPMDNYLDALGQILLRPVQITASDLALALQVLGFKDIDASTCEDIIPWLGYVPVALASKNQEPASLGSLVSLKVNPEQLNDAEKTALDVLMSFDRVQLPDQQIYSFARPDSLLKTLLDKDIELTPQEVPAMFKKLGFTHSVLDLIKAKQEGFNLYQVFEVEGAPGKVLDDSAKSSNIPGQYKIYETTPEILVMVRSILEPLATKIDPANGVRYVMGITVDVIKARVKLFSYDLAEATIREICHVLGFELQA